MVEQNPVSNKLQIEGIVPIQLLGIKVHPLTVSQLHYLMAYIVEQDYKSLILHVNVQAMNLAYDLQWMRDFLNSGDIVFCDGAGVKLGARLQGKYIPNRITYADWTWQFAEFAEPREYTFYLLGAGPGVADKAAQNLKYQFPELQVVGSHHGFFNKHPDSQENNAVVEEINHLRPNILVVGFGMPLQEKWLMQNWERLNVNIALTGGAVFDYVSGNLARAPKWMTDNSLEWLGRVLIEPRRLWRRYLLGNPLFLSRVIRQRLNLLKLNRQ